MQINEIFKDVDKTMRVRNKIKTSSNFRKLYLVLNHIFIEEESEKKESERDMYKKIAKSELIKITGWERGPLHELMEIFCVNEFVGKTRNRGRIIYFCKDVGIFEVFVEESKNMEGIREEKNGRK